MLNFCLSLSLLLSINKELQVTMGEFVKESFLAESIKWVNLSSLLFLQKRYKFRKYKNIQVIYTVNYDK